VFNYLILKKKEVSALNPSYSDAASQFACLHVSVSSLAVNFQSYGHSETTHKISPLLLHATKFKVLFISGRPSQVCSYFV